MKKYISDKALLDFTRLLIFDGRKPDDKIGIPIGNYTSQFFCQYLLKRTRPICKTHSKNPLFYKIYGRFYTTTAY